MHRTAAAIAVSMLLLASCGADDESTSPEVDVESDVAQAYLADLEEAGLDDVFDDAAAAVAFVETACRSAERVGADPEELIESGEVNAESRVALRYCDSELAG